MTGWPALIELVALYDAMRRGNAERSEFDAALATAAPEDLAALNELVALDWPADA